MARQILLFVSASLVTSALGTLAACGDSGMMMTDSGVDFGTDLGTDLGPPDLGLMPSMLYGPCVSSDQCPGADGTPGGGTCRHAADGAPAGYCTVPCTPP